MSISGNVGTCQCPTDVLPAVVHDAVHPFAEQGNVQFTTDFEDSTHPHVKTLVVQLGNEIAVIVLMSHDNIDFGRLATVAQLSKRRCAFFFYCFPSRMPD